MVRSVSRSKGCSLCLRRKVKCDEKVPQCSQCQRIREVCPGAFTGTIFIHTTPLQNPSTDPTKSTEKTTESPTSAPTTEDSLSTYQPSRTPFFDQLFLSHFVSSLTRPIGSGPHQSWMQCLYDFFETGDAPIKYSIRAASMTFYGQTTHDISIQQAARQWYMAALQELQVCLSPYLQNAQVSCTPSEQHICTSMMLLYFELISPSVIASWLKHLTGVTILLQLRGPEGCQSGLPHMLFRSLRLLEAYYSLRLRQPSIFASEQWRTIPFAESGKTHVDNIVDVLLLIPTLLLGRETSYFTMPQPPKPNPIVSLKELVSQLCSYEQQYLQTLSTSGGANPSIGTRVHNISAGHERLSEGSWIDGGGDFGVVIPELVLHSTGTVLDYLVSEGGLGSIERQAHFRQLRQPSLLFQFADAASMEGAPPLNIGSCVQLAFSLEVVESFSLSQPCREKALACMQRIGWEKLR